MYGGECEGDEAVLNEVILSELLPFMRVRGEKDCAEAISVVRSPGWTSTGRG